MGQALYRQYRPKSLTDVVGQEHITDTLAHALKQGKLAHAYLFTGPRGVGKTSIARILAHQINDLPYDDDATHLDIIEIDAASNRRIDEIRDLRDKVHTAPASASHKVYIIDEVHMLTKEAFNALLKTLEEPPAHVVFILATTEAHKLPETIVSRTQRFIFRPVDLTAVADHLEGIAKKEGINVEREALQLIAAYGEGSFRDSISLLDQTRGHDGTVSADVVRGMIGIPTDEAIQSLQTAVAAADAGAVVRTLSDLRTKGFAAPQVAKHLGRRIRQDILEGQAYEGVFELLDKLVDVPAAHDPDTCLELALVGHALKGHLPAAPTVAPVTQLVAPAAQVQQMPQASPMPVQPAVDTAGLTDAPSQPGALGSLKLQPKPAAADDASDTAGAAPSAAPMAAIEPRTNLGKRIPVDDKLWPAVLDELKKTHNTIYGIVRNARPVFYQQGLELGFNFGFHKRRISESKNKDVICGIMKDLTGQEISLHCVLIDKNAPEDLGGIPDFDDPDGEETASDTEAALKVKEKPLDPNVAAISNVFGSAEVLDK